MSVKKGIELGFRTIAVAIGLTMIFIIASMVSGMTHLAPAATGTATGPATGAGAEQPSHTMLMLLLASLIQAAVVTYLVLEAKWGGWKMAGALFLLVLNMWWVQSGIESWPYLRSHLPPHFITRILVMGLVVAALFAPFAVWVLRGFRRAVPEGVSVPLRWSPARWMGTLAATTLAFVGLYYLCGYYIAWQNPSLRQFYSGTTEMRSFWGQIAWNWSSTPWMIPLQAVRGLLFVALTLPAVRMLRGGAARVAIGTGLMYAVFDGSVGLILPNPILPPSVAHSHLIELAVWGVLFGVFVGWSMSQGRTAAPAKPHVAKAA